MASSGGQRPTAVEYAVRGLRYADGYDLAAWGDMRANLPAVMVGVVAGLASGALVIVLLLVAISTQFEIRLPPGG